MKKIFKIFQILIPTLLLGACNSEKLEINIDKEGVPFTINLTNKTIASRAAYYTENGVTGYNENVINRADVFFYIDVNADAVHKVSQTWDTPQEQEAEVDGTIPTDIVENADNLYAYVIVNGPSTPEVGNGTDTKIATLKQIEIEAFGYSDDDENDGFNTSTFPIDDFVMDGENTVTYDATAKKVSGTIYLNRAASKIALFITNLEPFVDGEGNTWTPQTTGMSVSFYNGVKASRINVEAVNDRTSGNYFSISDNANNGNARFSFAIAASDNPETTNVDESKAYTHFPFYSYSSDWGRESNPDNEAYLSLRIYWTKTKDKDGNEINNATPEAYYYRVPINLEDYTVNGTTYPGKQLQRNTYYKVLLEVGVLGDKSENSQVTLTPNYIVVDWNDEPVEVQLADYHYLVVEKNFVEMFNQESVTISYESCENVTAEIVYLARPNFTANIISTNVYYGNETNYENDLNFNSTTGTSRVAAPTTKTLTSLLYDCELSHNATGKEVTLNHQIQNDNDGDNDTGDYYDSAIYTIVVRLTTDCGLTEYVEIKQYPARYIEGELDNNKNYSYTTNGVDDSRGTVFINGYGGNDKSEGDDWYWVNNTLLGTGYNANPNMYIVTITSFDENQTNFIIADPRETEINNLTTSGWTTAPAKYGSTQRTLSYYYPTRTDNMNFIAPKLRITSAYGRLSGGDVSDGGEKLRCAAYQEYGYPAGRWRVPTAAELQYIGKLCADGVIPPLFNNGAAYYSATGGYLFQNGSFTYYGETAHSVRCVYDEWYWTDKCDEYTFTWGDQPR